MKSPEIKGNRSSSDSIYIDSWVREAYEEVFGGSVPKNMESILGHFSQVIRSADGCAIWNRLVPEFRVGGKSDMVTLFSALKNGQIEINRITQVLNSDHLAGYGERTTPYNFG